MRNLESIKKQLDNLKGWVAGFLEISKGYNKSRLEEVSRHVCTIELSIDSGYEDWVDILPELKKEKEAQEKIDEKYQKNLRFLVNKLLDKKNKLYQSSSKEEEGKLAKKVSQLELQIKALKNGDGGMIFDRSIRHDLFTRELSRSLRPRMASHNLRTSVKKTKSSSKIG